MAVEEQLAKQFKDFQSIKAKSNTEPIIDGESLFNMKTNLL